MHVPWPGWASGRCLTGRSALGRLADRAKFRKPTG
jgi:hypothetical protein